MGREDDARGGTDSAEFLDSHTVHDVVATRTAILRGDRDAHKSNFRHFLDGLDGETFLFVDLGGERFDLFFCKFAYHLQEESFLFG